jgi:hypothetical protein
MTNPAEDMFARWQPTDRAIRHARALLAAEPAASHALVPMYQPGKRRGWWEAGQLVKTVPGVVLLSVDSVESVPGVPRHGVAREMACQIAREALRADGRGGTVAYAVVDADRADVFEYSEQIEPTATD